MQRRPVWAPAGGLPGQLPAGPPHAGAHERSELPFGDPLRRRQTEGEERRGDEGRATGWGFDGGWMQRLPSTEPTRRTCNLQTPAQEDEARGAARLLHNCQRRVAERCEGAESVVVAALDPAARQPRGATCNGRVVQCNGRPGGGSRPGCLKTMDKRNQAGVCLSEAGEGQTPVPCSPLRPTHQCTGWGCACRGAGRRPGRQRWLPPGCHSPWRPGLLAQQSACG